MPRPISLIVIHCSASPNGESLFRAGRTPVEEIDAWHQARGFRRDPMAVASFNRRTPAIGYHYVIYTNGAGASGRAEDEIGAHARGYNRESLGICLVGTDRFTIDQWSALTHLVSAFRGRWPRVAVRGHNELPDVHKACPGFPVQAWLERGMISDPEHTL